MPIYSRLKLADLQGEDMLRFKTGDQLYPYCKDCEHSATTPVTHVLGCTVGDNPSIIDFDKRLGEGKTNHDIEKCPMYTQKGISAEGDVAPIEASVNEAGLVKELPPGEVINSPNDYGHLLDEAIERIEDDNDRATVKVLTDELDRQTRTSYQDPEQEYDFQGRKRDLIATYQEISDEGEEVSSPHERDAFHEFLRSAGLDAMTPDATAKNIISQAMLSWNGGLMASQLNDTVIESILEDFRSRDG